ncbi:MAG: hypothetical protein SGI90_15200 [Candidatus Eisenbacteria bacterium]|nr:hypothetical protein [Candidatus Eisenbacteria bacterium]
MTDSIQLPVRYPAWCAGLRAIGILCYLLLAVVPSARAAQLEFFASEEELERERTIDHLAVQTRDGLEMLARWYIQGSMTPIPDPTVAEFLYARATHRGESSWRDAALGMTGSWAGLHLNDFLKWGAVDSVRSDIPLLADGKPRKIKTLAGQAALVHLFTMAWQVSDKEMFRRAATRTADDLVGWSFRGETLLAWTSNDPDTLAGPAATADEMGSASAQLVEAAVVFQELRWAPEWLVPLVPEPAPCSPEPVGMPSSPADTIAAARSALALMRYGNWTHSDSLLEHAASYLTPLSLAGTVPTHDMPLFVARATAGLTLELLARPSVMAYIVGEPTDPATRALRDAAIRAWRPGRLVQVRSADAPDLLYPPSGDDKPLAYVCSGELCAPPTSDAAEVNQLVRTFSLPDPPAVTAPTGH